MKTGIYTHTIVQNQIENLACSVCHWLKRILLCLVLTLHPAAGAAAAEVGTSGGKATARGQAPSELRILDIQFEPIRSGKNVVYVKVQNAAKEGRTLLVHIQTVNNLGWGTVFSDWIEGGSGRWIRYAFKIFGQPTDEGYAYLDFFDGAEARKANTSFHYREFPFPELTKIQADGQAAQSVLPAVRDTMMQAFEDLRRDIRDRNYPKVRAYFTHDMLDAEFQRPSVADFARRIDLPNPFGWCRGEILALKPLSVTGRNGVCELQADLAGQLWKVGFLYCDGQWKIDHLDGFMPSHATEVLIKRLRPLLQKRSTDHLDIYYFPGSKAAADIDQIAREREAGVQAVNQFLTTPTSQRLCLVLFEDLDTKAWVMIQTGVRMADGYMIAEVYDDQVKLNPYHEATHALTSELGNPPAAFLEGIAEYVSEKSGAAPLKGMGGGKATLYGFVSESRDRKQWIPLSQLLAYSNIGSEGPERNLLAYAEAGALAKYLVEAHGKEKFQEAYRQLQNSHDEATQKQNAKKLEQIYGASLTAVESQWIEAMGSAVGRSLEK